MIIRSLLPKLDPKTVKEKIIVILSSDYPLSIKEIKSKISLSFSQVVSYQAVHKELNQLIKESIIISQDKKYLLDLTWVKEVSLFSDLILSNYSKQKRHSINKLLELKNNGDSLSFEFSSLIEIDLYMLEILANFNQIFDKDKKIIMHYTHNWVPFVAPLKEKEVMEGLGSRYYSFCKGKCPLDQYACDYERSIGRNVLQTDNEDINWNVNIIGDLVFSYYCEQKIINEVEKFFESATECKDLNLSKLIDILKKKGQFRVLILKDRNLADKISQELQHFD